MKKIVILAGLLASLCVAGEVFATSATLEFQSIDNVPVKTTDQTNFNFTVRENVLKNLTGDVQFSQTNSDGTQGLSSSRIETGWTPTYTINEYFRLYARETIGEKYTSTTHNSYWSAEPGVTIPFGSTNLTAKLAWRFRTGFSDTALDTTRTWRVGLAYAVTSKDTIGVRYDRVQGNSDQRIMAVNYTRGF